MHICAHETNILVLPFLLELLHGKKKPNRIICGPLGPNLRQEEEMRASGGLTRRPTDPYRATGWKTE